MYMYIHVCTCTCDQQVLSEVREAEGVDAGCMAHHVLSVQAVGCSQPIAHVMSPALRRAAPAGHTVQLQALQDVGRQRAAGQAIGEIQATVWLRFSRLRKAIECVARFNRHLTTVSSSVTT